MVLEAEEDNGEVDFLSITKCILCKKDLTVDSEMDQSKLMECLHAVCHNCFNEWNDTGEKECHQCFLPSAKHKLRDNKVLSEIITDKTDSLDFCDMHKISVTHWCENCREYICNQCVIHHNQLKSTKEHSILPMHAYDLRKAPKSVFPCDTHPENQLTIMCITCSIMTCRDCQLELHRDHKYDFLNNLVPDTKKEIFSILINLEYSELVLRASLKRISGREHYLKDLKKSLMINIKKAYDELIDLVRKRAKVLMLEGLALLDDKLYECSVKKYDIEKMVYSLDRGSSLISAILSKSSDPVIFYSKETLLNYMNKLNLSTISVPNYFDSDCLKFVPEEFEKLKKTIEKCGRFDKCADLTAAVDGVFLEKATNAYLEGLNEKEKKKLLEGLLNGEKKKVSSLEQKESQPQQDQTQSQPQDAAQLPSKRKHLSEHQSKSLKQSKSSHMDKHQSTSRDRHEKRSNSHQSRNRHSGNSSGRQEHKTREEQPSQPVISDKQFQLQEKQLQDRQPQQSQLQQEQVQQALSQDKQLQDKQPQQSQLQQKQLPQAQFQDKQQLQDKQPQQFQQQQKQLQQAQSQDKQRQDRKKQQSKPQNKHRHQVQSQHRQSQLQDKQQQQSQSQEKQPQQSQSQDKQHQQSQSQDKQQQQSQFQDKKQQPSQLQNEQQHSPNKQMQQLGPRNQKRDKCKVLEKKNKPFSLHQTKGAKDPQPPAQESSAKQTDFDPLFEKFKSIVEQELLYPSQRVAVSFKEPSPLAPVQSQLQPQEQPQTLKSVLDNIIANQLNCSDLSVRAVPPSYHSVEPRQENQHKVTTSPSPVEQPSFSCINLSRAVPSQQTNQHKVTSSLEAVRKQPPVNIFVEGPFKTSQHQLKLDSLPAVDSVIQQRLPMTDSTCAIQSLSNQHQVTSPSAVNPVIQHRLPMTDSTRAIQSQSNQHQLASPPAGIPVIQHRLPMTDSTRPIQSQSNQHQLACPPAVNQVIQHRLPMTDSTRPIQSQSNQHQLTSSPAVNPVIQHRLPMTDSTRAIQSHSNQHQSSESARIRQLLLQQGSSVTISPLCDGPQTISQQTSQHQQRNQHHQASQHQQRSQHQQASQHQQRSQNQQTSQHQQTSYHQQASQHQQRSYQQASQHQQTNQNKLTGTIRVRPELQQQVPTNYTKPSTNQEVNQQQYTSSSPVGQEVQQPLSCVYTNQPNANQTINQNQHPNRHHQTNQPQWHSPETVSLPKPEVAIESFYNSDFRRVRLEKQPVIVIDDEETQEAPAISTRPLYPLQEVLSELKETLDRVTEEMECTESRVVGYGLPTLR